MTMKKSYNVLRYVNQVSLRLRKILCFIAKIFHCGVGAEKGGVSGKAIKKEYSGATPLSVPTRIDINKIWPLTIY